MRKLTLSLLLSFSIVFSACTLASPQPENDKFSIALEEAAAPENTATVSPAQTESSTTLTLTTLPSATQTAAPILIEGDPLPHLKAGAVSITYIDMHTENVGWAMGGLQDPGGHVLHTSDGGQTWRDVTPPEPLDIDEKDKIPAGYFLDENTAWITFDYLKRFDIPLDPIIWFTEDGGENWQAIGQLHNLSLAEEDYEVQFIEFTDTQHGWILVYLGAGMSHNYVALYATRDGGHTWDLLIDPYSDTSMQLCQKTSLAFADTNRGVITIDCFGVVDGAQILQTSDGGASWQSQEIPVEQLGMDIESIPPYCYTHAPNITSRADSLLELHIALTCQTLNDGKQTEYNFILRTIDGGENWDAIAYAGGEVQRVRQPSSETEVDTLFILGTEIYSVAPALKAPPELIKKVIWQGQFSFINAEFGWAVARNGDDLALVYTTDHGENWGILEPLIIAP